MTGELPYGSVGLAQEATESWTKIRGMGLPTEDPMDRGNTVYQPLYLIFFNLNFPH